MKRTKRLVFLSLISSLIIIVSSILGIILSIIKYGFVESVRTFGVICNFLLIIGAIVLFVYDCKSMYDNKDETTKGIYVYMLVFSVCIIDAGLLSVLLYTNNKDIIYTFSIGGLFLHLISPIFAFILVLITIIKYPFELKDSFFCTIPTIIYGCIYLFMILASGKELDYYGIYDQSNLWFLYTYLILFIGISFILSLFIIFVHNHVTSFGSNSKLMLRNGIGIPRVGIRTTDLKNKNVEQCIEDAISVGYTHIDIDATEEDELSALKGIAASGLDRKKLFISSKVPSYVKTYDETKKSIDKTLNNLQTKYIDLLLIDYHPNENKSIKDSYTIDQIKSVWKAIEEEYMAGKVKAIGVCNFNKPDLEILLSISKIPPMVNQICCYIGSTPQHLIKFCNKNKIIVEAYSPMGNSGDILSDKRIKDIAIKYNISIARLCVRYAIDLGCVSLPKSTNIEHMRENFDTDTRIKSTDIELMSNFAELEFAIKKEWPIYNQRRYYEIDK